MKCSKCEAEFSNDVKFCSYCGEKLESPDSSNDEIVKKEDLSTNNSLTIADKTKAKAGAFWRKQSLVGRFSIVSILIFIVLGLIAFLAGRILSGIFAVVAIAIVVVAVLMEKQVIKVPKTWIALLAVILSLVMIIPYFSLFKVNVDEYERYKWNEIVLADIIPKPKSTYGEIVSNSEDYLILYITKTTETQYKDYIEACKEKGFTTDSEFTENYFCAFNKNGYKISLSYYDYSSEMHISLESGMKMETLIWPDSEKAKLLPVPKSTQGKIDSNDEDVFSVYIGNTTIEDYKAYVKACEEKGFNINVQKNDKTFSAKNADAYKLSIDYKGNNVIYISVTEPEFDVTIEVECVKNWIFSKYDVNFFVNDDLKNTIPHGDKETFDIVLKRGKHKISFESAEDDTLDGEVEIIISKKETIKLKISCSSAGIDIEVLSGTIATEDDSSKDTTSETDENMAAAPDVWSNMLEKHYEEVKKQFEDAGFTNITCVACEIDYDENYVFEGSVVNIAVGENGDICVFEKGEQWPKDIKIRIDYRVKPAEQEKTPTSEYEKAFVSQTSNYKIYYMFDTDTNEVITFNSDDTYVDKGIFRGNFNSGVKIIWDHGEWTEKFINKDGSNNATMIDGNGYDWDYKVCSVEIAQTILNKLQ